jgi:hypothetical protein
MARTIPNEERVRRAQDLIQQARDLPVPPEAGKYDLNYIADVKTLLRQARDLIKFIHFSPSASDELKQAASETREAADQADQELLRG